jgi:trimeric autotransporter adhesin
MKTKIQFLLLTLAYFSGIHQMFAQGTAFTYQGRLNNGGGAANGLYDFRFRLAADALGDTYVGNVALTNGIGVSNGLFTTAIDFGAGIFNGTNYWLEVDVRTNGVGGYTPLSPLQAMTPTPYALFANSASNVTGVLPASKLSGIIPAALLPSSVVTNNAAGLALAGTFTGNGSGLTGVNATLLGGLTSANFWKTNGNTGANPTNGAFIGTTDNLPLEFKVHAQRALRIEYATNYLGPCPNMISGSSANIVSNGFAGAVIGGGGSTNSPNCVGADFAAVIGGYGNTASGEGSLAMGEGNTVSAGESFAMGNQNTVSGTYAAAIGFGCRSGGLCSFVLGNGSSATGDNSVAMGVGNIASGVSSVALGGSFTGGNTASGNYSTAMGVGANAVHDDSFVWSDGTSFASTQTKQFSVQAAGGVLLAADVQLGTGSGDYHHMTFGGGNSSGFIYGSYPKFQDFITLGYNYYADANGDAHIPNPAGGSSRVSVGYGEVIIQVGGAGAQPTTPKLDVTTASVTVYGTFNNSSDRNAKQDFAPVSPAQILDKVLQLPVSEWSYKTDAATRHIGPMGQDFYSVFNIGTDEKHIAPIDEGGVALAAIQGLNQKVDAKDAEIQTLKRQNESLVGRMNKLESMLDQLAAQK